MLEVKCPHCDGTVIIEQRNCCIFRHGIFKNTGRQIPPHASKENCEAWIREGKLWGCGKPFRLEGDKAVVCEYI